MPSILNSDDGVVSGSSGLKTTGGNDGILVFQKNGTETARINTDSQIVAAAGTASLPIYSTTGDLNTGIFFPAADTIAFAEGGAEAMRIDSNANLQFNSGYGSVATAFGCRAWVNFNGSGAVAIRGSGNVSSITDNGTGDYTVNFTTAMPDANYCTVTSSRYLSTSSNQILIQNVKSGGTYSTSAVQVLSTSVVGSNTGMLDVTMFNVAIFR